MVEHTGYECPFCKQCKDSHSHLFFSCHFARRLWERLKIMANLGFVSNCWPQVISSIVNIPSKNSIWSVIQRLVWGAAVYHIWQERNVRLFGGYNRTEDELFKSITEAVRFRIMGLQLKVTPDVISSAKVWGFPINNSYKFQSVLNELVNDNMDIDNNV